jgi:hypothetical protein
LYDDDEFLSELQGKNVHVHLLAAVGSSTAGKLLSWNSAYLLLESETHGRTLIPWAAVAIVYGTEGLPSTAVMAPYVATEKSSLRDMR